MPQELPNKYSELRQDIVSGDWVVVATGRAKRPNDFVAKKKPKISLPKKVCPFDKQEERSRIGLLKSRRINFPHLRRIMIVRWLNREAFIAWLKAAGFMS